MSKDMDNKKIRVAYYDCVDGRVPRKLKESIELVNLAVHDIEESGEYEVIIARVDVILKDSTILPCSAFAYSVIKGNFGTVDKVVFSTMMLFKAMRRIKKLYEDLTKAGIALEFLMEGPVDENFIEAYSFVITRNSIWHRKRIRNIISPLDRNALLKAECINPSTAVRSYNYKKSNRIS